MINCYRRDVFKSVDEDATTKLIVEGIYNHCSRCSNFIPEINDKACCYYANGHLTKNPNTHLIRCVHYVACLQTLNREAANNE